jgi:hypothetical protein
MQLSMTVVADNRDVELDNICNATVLGLKNSAALEVFAVKPIALSQYVFLSTFVMALDAPYSKPRIHYGVKPFKFGLCGSNTANDLRQCFLHKIL